MAVQEKSKRIHQRHLAPRDLSILTLVMQQRAIRLDQVPHFITLFETTSGSTHEAHVKSSAHNLVERLQREGLLHLQRFEKDQPWIWLTKEGMHVLGSSSSWKRPARNALPFLYAVNAVRLLLTEQDPQSTWMSQQQIRSSAARKSSYPLPTAELITDRDERIAIHVVFRLTGTDEQIATRMHQQLERETTSGSPSYTALWYYASNDAAKQLRAARVRVAKIATKELARNICIFSYPLQKQLLYRGHHSPVRTLAWSPDGRSLASVGEELHIWNATTGKEQLRLPIPASPSIVGWSCEGLWIGLGDNEGGLSIWESTSGKGPLIAIDHPGRIVGLAWSPQHNDLIATCSASGKLQLYDVCQNSLQWETSSKHGAASLAWSPDGSHLAVGGNDNVVCIFNATTGKLLRAFTKHRNACTALAWSPDSQLLASAAHDHTILIWDATTGKKRRTIGSSLGTIDILAWSPDGARLACAGGNPCVQIWNIHTGRLLQTYKDHADAITSIAWSPHNTMLASASNDGVIHVYPAVGGSL